MHREWLTGCERAVANAPAPSNGRHSASTPSSLGRTRRPFYLSRTGNRDPGATFGFLVHQVEAQPLDRRNRQFPVPEAFRGSPTHTRDRGGRRVGDPSLLRDTLTDRVEDCAPPGSVPREGYLTPEFTAEAEALAGRCPPKHRE